MSVSRLVLSGGYYSSRRHPTLVQLLGSHAKHPRLGPILTSISAGLSPAAARTPHQIGCVIVGPNHEIRSTGYNSFPRGIRDDVPERLERPAKYLWLEHAERNAICNAGARRDGHRGVHHFTSRSCVHGLRPRHRPGRHHGGGGFLSAHDAVFQRILRPALRYGRGVIRRGPRSRAPRLDSLGTAAAHGLVRRVLAGSLAVHSCKKRHLHARHRKGCFLSATMNLSFQPWGMEWRTSRPPQAGHRIYRRDP